MSRYPIEQEQHLDEQHRELLGALHDRGMTALKGLTMRDFFAASALRSMDIGIRTASMTAEAAYEIADAMLKVRDQS